MVQFQIPGAFVAATALPTAGELRLGFEDGWLIPAGVVEVTLAKMESGLALDEPEESLALLLSDELDSVEDLIEQIPVNDEMRKEGEAFWLFMALAFLLAHRTDYGDPLGIIEMIYSDFDYPVDIEGLVRYMPPSAGQPTGLPALERRWLEYVERRKADYARRAGLMKR